MFVILYDLQNDTYTDDFGLLSVVGTDLVSPSTLAFYICQQYSLVFVVDMSTNMMDVVSLAECISLSECISDRLICWSSPSNQSFFIRQIAGQIAGYRMDVGECRVG